jgi:hypothetical protein
MFRFFKFFAVLALLVSVIAAPDVVLAQTSDDSSFESGSILVRSGTGADQLWGRVSSLYDHATGLSGNSCISCDFFSYFAVALNAISQAVFIFARGYALTLMPILGALYLMFSVGKDLVSGEVKPTEFLAQKGKVIISFALVFLLISGIPLSGFKSGSTTLHSLVGPKYLQTTFDLSGQIRGAMGKELSSIATTTEYTPEMLYSIPEDKRAMFAAAERFANEKYTFYKQNDYPDNLAERGAFEWASREYPGYGIIKESVTRRDNLIARVNNASSQSYDPFLGCKSIKFDHIQSYIDSTYTDPDHHKSTLDSEFVKSATEQACFIERVHMVGFSTGLAVVSNDLEAGSGALSNYLIESFVQVILGLLIMYVFAASAVYMIFLVLDIVVRGLITAALSPALAVMWLFPSSRPMVKQAGAQLIGAIGTAVALAIGGGIAMTLFLKVVDIYNSLASEGGQFADLAKLPVQGTLAGYRDFLAATLGVVPEYPRIPLTFSAPWTWYLIFTGLAVPAMTKAIIKMIEGVLGTSGQDTLATTALKTAQSSMALAQQGGQLAALGSLNMAQSGSRWVGGKIFGGGEGAGDIMNTTGGLGRQAFDATGDIGLSDAPAAGKSATDIIGKAGGLGGEK